MILELYNHGKYARLESLQLIDFDDVHFLVRCLRYRFRTEKLPLKTLMRLDLKGAAVIDVGANKGIYCFCLSRAVGQSGKVLAFEPQPEMIRYIQSRKRCFAFDNIETIETALSDHSGAAQLTRQRIGDGSASLQIERQRSGNEEIDVPLARLDDFEVANLKFIKCDVEGHELSMFTGARRLIETLSSGRAVREPRNGGRKPVLIFQGTRLSRHHVPRQPVPSVLCRLARSPSQVWPWRSSGLPVFSRDGSTIPLEPYRRIEASDHDKPRRG